MLNRILNWTMPLVLVWTTFGMHLNAQDLPQIQYADKAFYLLDSLDLQELVEPDRILLDSCLTRYHHSKDNKSRIDALGGIIEGVLHESWTDYLNIQHSQVKAIIKEGVYKDEEEQHFYKECYAGIIGNLAYIEDETGHAHKALDLYDEARKIYEEINSKSGMATIYNNIGSATTSLGDIEGGLKNHYKSLKLFEELGDKEGTGITLCNIAFIYEEQGEEKKAMEYFERSLKLAQEINDLQSEGYVLNNIGYIYEAKGEIDVALDYFIKSLKIRRKIGDLEGVATSLNSIAISHLDLGNLDTAYRYYEESGRIRNEIGDLQGLTHSLEGLTRIELDRNNVEKAEGFAKRSMKIAQEIQYPLNISSSAWLLSEVYEKKGEASKALEMYKLHVRMKDSVHSEQIEREVIRTQTQYAYEKKKIQDDVENRNRLAVAKEKQQLIIYTSLIGTVILLVFLLVIYNRLKVTRRQKRIIEVVKGQVEEKNEEIHSSITYAKRIQRSVLPELRRDELFTDSFLMYLPKDVVSGDFYWWEAKGDQVFFAVADCTGHGVPGGFMSMLGSIFLNEIFNSKHIYEPAKILDELSRLMDITLRDSDGLTIKDGMDISFAHLDRTTNVLQWAGANNPLYILRAGDSQASIKSIEVIKPDKQPIGYFQNRIPYVNHRIELVKGDCLYLFTDGFADQFGGKLNKKIGYKKFRELLLEMQSESMEEQKVRLETYFWNWIKEGDDEQIDDVCVMGVRVGWSESPVQNEREGTSV